MAKNWGTESLSDLPQVTQLVNWVVWIWNHTIQLQTHSFHLPPSSVLLHISSRLMPNPFIHLKSINGALFMFQVQSQELEDMKKVWHMVPGLPWGKGKKLKKCSSSLSSVVWGNSILLPRPSLTYERGGSLVNSTPEFSRLSMGSHVQETSIPKDL